LSLSSFFFLIQMFSDVVDCVPVSVCISQSDY